MRKNFGAKPWTYPQPVFIVASYDENGVPDAMNAAWGGISDDTQISLCLSAGHKTVANILKSKAFTVSMADAQHVVECSLVSYDSETCRLVGEIVNVSIDESILTDDGKTDMSRFSPIVFDPINSVYLKLGEKAGNAFKDGRKLK